MFDTSATGTACLKGVVWRGLVVRTDCIAADGAAAALDVSVVGIPARLQGSGSRKRPLSVTERCKCLVLILHYAPDVRLERI
jgi:hypothetical protein